MIKFTTQELELESNLKQHIEFICEFCHTTPKIINGSIKRINNTNLNYLESHKIIINNSSFKIKRLVIFQTNLTNKL